MSVISQGLIVSSSRTALSFLGSLWTLFSSFSFFILNSKGSLWYRSNLTTCASISDENDGGSPKHRFGSISAMFLLYNPEFLWAIPSLRFDKNYKSTVIIDISSSSRLWSFLSPEMPSSFPWGRLSLYRLSKSTSETFSPLVSFTNFSIFSVSDSAYCLTRLL